MAALQARPSSSIYIYIYLHNVYGGSSQCGVYVYMSMVLTFKAVNDASLMRAHLREISGNLYQLLPFEAWTNGGVRRGRTKLCSAAEDQKLIPTGKK